MEIPMKNRIRFSVVAACALVFALALVVQADSPKVMKWDVPFEFSVGDTLMPAGEYTLEVVQASYSGPLMKIKHSNGNDVALFMAKRTQEDFSADKPRLFFNRYEDQYFLSKVWEQPGASWTCLSKGEREKAVARELKLAGTSKPKVVAILAGSKS
jgi:hypothetical protein